MIAGRAPSVRAAPVRLARGVFALRDKAILAFAGVVLYLVAGGAVLSLQRANLITHVEVLETLYQNESTLARVNTSASQAILKINEGDFTSEPARIVAAVEPEIRSIAAGLGGMAGWHPRAGTMVQRLQQALERARQTPSRSGVIELRTAMNQLAADLDQVAREVRARHDRVWSGYRTNHDTVTLTAVMLFMLGVALFGGIVMVFFRRLAWDLRALSDRAVEVVRGYRGPALAVSRQDEVGDLMDSVNHMQQILRERERQIEVSRQQRFHQEKMGAIGALAAAVAHEINNPIAAIEGVAQNISDERRAGCPAGGATCQAELIFEHTRRIVAITRQLSELTSPQSTEPEWADLNALTRATCAFVTFDPRLRDVKLILHLDTAIPAAWAVADHVTQILMYLLINAADALKISTTAAKHIEVSTAPAGDFVRLVVSDSAGGMSGEVAGRAFEEGFTTKEHGSGIGLFMCKTLVEKGAGSIALESRVGEGTTITVSLPCHDRA